MQLSYQSLARALAAVEVPVAREFLATDAATATAVADGFGTPVVLKLISPALIHKSDVGAVILGLEGRDEVAAAAERLQLLATELGLDEAGWHILVQEMIPTSGPELFVGLKRDDVFGPVIIVGAGGRLIELFPDRAIAACPVSPVQASVLLRRLTIGRALGGYRGQEDVIDQVAEVIAAASRLPEHVPGLVEADLNPIVLTDQGPKAVDARIAVEEGVGAAPTARRPRSRDFRTLMEPRSVLVIGASASGADMPGNRVLQYLRKREYPGAVTVVHPTAQNVDGYPAVPEITALPVGSVDLVCVAVAAKTCPEVLERCGSIGVGAAVVLSSGFSEVGEEQLEEQLVATADRHGMILCGPNTVGVMSPGLQTHISFSQAQAASRVPNGTVALVVQSGAIGGGLASQAWERGIGISRFISVGNQAMYDVTDYLAYLSDDSATDTIAVVLEGVSQGRALLSAVAQATERGKRVLVIKSGRTSVGARAVQSHTGSVAGDYAVYRELLTGAGAIVVDTTTELLDTLAVCDAGLQLAPGSRVGVISTSGGMCSITADLCSQYGLQVPVFSAELQARLGAILPAFATIGNPVDLTGRVITEPSILGQSAGLMLDSSEIDAVAVTITTVADPMATDLAAQIVEQSRRSNKPIIVTWCIAAELAPRGLAILREAGIPVFDDPARALRSVHLAGSARKLPTADR